MAHSKFVLAVIALLFPSLLIIKCRFADEVDPPFDIEILQYACDQKKPEFQWNLESCSNYCFEEMLGYFQEGCEVLMKLSVNSELDDKIKMTMSYFGHMVSPSAGFVEISDDKVIKECENSYRNYVDLCELSPYFVNLKMGIHYYSFRIKLKDCKLTDGYFWIRLPISLRGDIGSDLEFEYIKSWELYPVFFKVNEGVISAKPINYNSHVWPVEIFEYLKNVK